MGKSHSWCHFERPRKTRYVSVRVCGGSVLAAGAESPTPRLSYRHQNKYCRALKLGLHQYVCLMECKCVFSMLLSPQLHSECPWMEEGLLSEDTPSFAKYGRQHWPLKGQKCVNVRLFALKHEILSYVAACEQKVHISTVFTCFAVESSSWACLMTGNCLVAVWFLVCLSVYLPLPQPISLSVFYLLPPLSPISPHLYIWRYVAEALSCFSNLTSAYFYHAPKQLWHTSTHIYTHCMHMNMYSSDN